MSTFFEVVDEIKEVLTAIELEGGDSRTVLSGLVRRLYRGDEWSTDVFWQVAIEKAVAACIDIYRQSSNAPGRCFLSRCHRCSLGLHLSFHYRSRTFAPATIQ